jgi:CheY-like chemotaxis protein
LNERKHLKLLLAEDDKPIANIYRTGLPELFAKGAGGDETPVSVTVCSQGGAAVDLFEEARRNGEPFDVIVLDVRMPPGISGVEAAEKIRCSDQQVPIIFVSGYSDETIPNLEERVPPASQMCYVEKPIQLSELADLIVEMARA